MGPCLTDAAPKDRSQRTARISTAMMPPERMRRQSSRLSWPGGSILTSMTATATTRILAQPPRLSREQTVAGSIRRSPVNSTALAGAQVIQSAASATRLSSPSGCAPLAQRRRMRRNAYVQLRCPLASCARQSRDSPIRRRAVRATAQ